MNFVLNKIMVHLIFVCLEVTIWHTHKLKEILALSNINSVYKNWHSADKLNFSLMSSVFTLNLRGKTNYYNYKTFNLLYQLKKSTDILITILVSLVYASNMNDAF